MASSAARKEKKEIDVVGEQRNWDQCISSELEIAKAWCENWGPLYEGSMTQRQQLEMLQSKLERKKTDRGQRSAFPSGTSPFAPPLIIAYRGSAFPWLVDDRAALRSRRICLPAHKGTQTNYQLSFKGEPPFDEYAIGPMQKNVLRMEDVEQLAKEMMAAQLRK